MNEANLDWDDLRLFLGVARQGGLAAAAESTGKSAPTLGRRMLELERKLNAELFDRHARGYLLTEAGQSLLENVARLEEHVSPIANAGHDKTAPIVKVSAGTWVSHVLCNKLDELITGEQVLLRFIAADHVLDIGHREAVIGIRNKRPDQIGLAGRRVGRVRFGIYAVDEGVATWARVIGTTPSARWSKDNIKGRAAIEVTHARNALDLALSGAARAVLPTFIGDFQKSLQRIGPEIEVLEHEQWLVSHHEDRFMPEVRGTIERIYSLLRRLCD